MLSLEGVMDTGLAPAADAIVTEVEVEVTDTRTCSRFSLTIREIEERLRCDMMSMVMLFPGGHCYGL